MFTIEIKAPELAAAIENLAAALKGASAPTEIKTEIKEEPKKSARSSGKKNTETAAPMAETVVEPTTETAAEVKTESETAPFDVEKTESALTLDDVRKVFTPLVQAGKQQEVKAILEKFEVAKLSDLKPETFEQAIAMAEALNG
jgi:hypothetical protein